MTAKTKKTSAVAMFNCQVTAATARDNLKAWGIDAEISECAMGSIQFVIVAKRHYKKATAIETCRRQVTAKMAQPGYDVFARFG